MTGNALANETSPYLLQHAGNPVAWYPWGSEALEMAHREDKPILLSIGYSACHWCHVMAHESFEEEETAALMNKLFINIKVDREERPDLDRIYQTAHQLLAQRGGGWPLTMFLTPDEQMPFFAGTYFPKQPRYGMPAFKDVLVQIHAVYRDHRSDILEQNASLRKALNDLSASGSGQAVITPSPLDAVREYLRGGFDKVHGGFGRAPKFPQPAQLERLMRHYGNTASGGQADREAWRIAGYTLKKMALGGIYDQLDGGFCRYSVDEKWMIPHFEKMLYDNGPLLALYSEAWQLSREPLFYRISRETAEWVRREMQSPEGGYYSSLDADSEGEEGKYYAWSADEVRTHLTEEEYAIVARHFGLDHLPNFEGKWHLHVSNDINTLAEENETGEIQRLLESARAKLLAVRDTRVRPGRDEKILTSWNALMIKGMATAGRIFQNPDWTTSAERALDFLRALHWRDGHLLATSKDGTAHLAAYLDDYAFLMDGVLSLLMARWRQSDLEFAIQLAEVLLDAFEDREHGGFYFTAHEHETLFHRPKPMHDESMPAGNGIAAHALARLGHLLGEQRYLDAAERTIMAAWPDIEHAPYGHNALLLAVEEYLYPPPTVVLRGTPEGLRPWLERCQRNYAPRRLSLAIPSDAKDLPGILSQHQPGTENLAYVCEGFQCGPPIADLDALEAVLGKTEVAGLIEL